MLQSERERAEELAKAYLRMRAQKEAREYELDALRARIAALEAERDALRAALGTARDDMRELAYTAENDHEITPRDVVVHLDNICARIDTVLDTAQED